MALQLKIGKSFSLTVGKTAPQMMPDADSLATINPETYRSVLYTQEFIDFLKCTKDADIFKAITECPQVASILYRKCQMFANGKTEVLIPSNDNYVTGQRKAFQKLIDQPNVIQGGTDFKAQVRFYTLAFGYCPILKIAPVGMPVSSMWIIPPHVCDITWKKILPYYVSDYQDLIEKIEVTWKGKKYNIPKEDVYVIPDNTNQRVDNFLPVSRITVLKPAITAAIQNYKSRIRLTSKPFGILSNPKGDNTQTIPLKDPERKLLVQAFKQNYGVNEGQSDVVITNAGLQWQPMMYPIRDMQLLELMKSDAAVMCDTFGYDFDLLSRDLGGVALSNKETAGLFQYQNFEEPAALDFDGHMMKILDGETNLIKIVTSFSHLPVYQLAEKSAAECAGLKAKNALFLFKENMITHDEAMQEMERETVPEYVGLYYHQMPHVLEAQARQDAQMTANQKPPTE